MKFEEALTALRSGAKIRHPTMKPDEYYMGCYVGLNMEMFGMPPEDFEELKARGMSIVRMQGDKQHPEMKPQIPTYNEYVDLLNKYPFLQEKLAYPTINLLLITSDEWKILNE